MHLLHIWLLPKSRGIAPGHAQEHFDVASKQDRHPRWSGVGAAHQGTVEFVRLGPGDGVAIVSSQVALKRTADAELLVFDLGVPA